MSAHTPTPWREHAQEGQPSDDYLQNEMGQVVAIVPQKEHRTLIVRAVNAHAELVAALEHALTDLEELNLGRATIEDVCGVIPELRAALAKAKGQP